MSDVGLLGFELQWAALRMPRPQIRGTRAIAWVGEPHAYGLGPPGGRFMSDVSRARRATATLQLVRSFHSNTWRLCG